MSSNVYLESSNFMADLRKQTDRVIVAYSGGKDSLVALDLATKTFPTVIPVLYYFVPDLALDQERIDYVRDRYSLIVQPKQAFHFYDALLAGTYCFRVKIKGRKLKVTPKLDYEIIKHEFGCQHVLTGCRRTDSWQRRQMLDAGILPGTHPIADWNKYNVLAYLRRNNIPLPPTHAGSTSGIGLTARSILWLYDEHKSDYEKIARFFPFVEAIIHRRVLYNVPRAKAATRAQRLRQVNPDSGSPLPA